eukprot:6383723-Ditylum_brightwellii.AAC.2
MIQKYNMLGGGKEGECRKTANTQEDKGYCEHSLQKGQRSGTQSMWGPVDPALMEVPSQIQMQSCIFPVCSNLFWQDRKGIKRAC